MTTALTEQLLLARSILETAGAKKDIGRANFALGLLIGALTTALPKEQHHPIIQGGLNIFELPREATLAEVTEAANALIRRGYNIR